MARWRPLSAAASTSSPAPQSRPSAPRVRATGCGVAFTIDVEEQTGFAMGMAAMLARGMPGPTAPLAALPRLLGVTGNGKSLLEHHGLIGVSGTGSAKTATLTRLGERVRDAHAAAVAAVEEQWHERYGPAAAELADALAGVDARLPACLPDHVAVRHVVGGGFADVSSAV